MPVTAQAHCSTCKSGEKRISFHTAPSLSATIRNDETTLKHNQYIIGAFSYNKITYNQINNHNNKNSAQLFPVKLNQF